MNKLHAAALAVFGLLLSVAASPAKDFPSGELTGTWRGHVEIFGSFKVEPYPSKAAADHQDVIITIASSGAVSGRIGQARFSGCTVHRNRGWLGRKLNIKTDYIILGGYMEGPITPRDKGAKREFTIPFNITNGRLSGTIMLLPKFPLTRPLNLEKEE